MKTIIQRITGFFGDIPLKLRVTKIKKGKIVSQIKVSRI